MRRDAVQDHGLRRNTRRHAVCGLIENAHSLRRAARALDTFGTIGETDLTSLHRLRHRVDGASDLISETTKNFKLVGVDKDEPILEIDGERKSLQEVLRKIRTLQSNVDSQIRSAGADEPGKGKNGHGEKEATAGDAVVVVIIAFAVAVVVAVGKWLGEQIAEMLNQTDDDAARERISKASHDDIRRLGDDELVGMLFALMDGPTGDDDEAAILKLLEALDCDRRARIVGRVGLGELLSDVDGAEWDRLVNLLTDCGIIGMDQLDDDASRFFVNTRVCAQLSILPMPAVRQLVLNMFSGSCGDDDEDAILKLLRCQSTARLHELVSLSGTDVGEFDWNFDGSQWDDLESFFAANGIELDP